MLAGQLQSVVQENNIVKVSGSVEFFSPLEAAYYPAEGITLKVFEKDENRLMSSKTVSGTYNCLVRNGGEYELHFSGSGFSTTIVKLSLIECQEEKLSMPVILFPEFVEADLSDSLTIVAINDSIMGLVMPGLQQKLASKESQLMADYTRHYIKMLDQANAWRKRGNRERAMEYYKSAQRLSPSSRYIQSRIEEVKQQITRQHEDYDSYLRTLRVADSLFQQGSLEQARAIYMQAIAMQHHDTYPNRQISAIERWKREQTQKERQAVYKQKRCALMIEEADSYFRNRLIQVARRLYINALNECPQKDYLKTQIARIDAIQDRRRRMPPPSRPSADEYHQLITTADSLMLAKEWAEARELYEHVYRMFPDLPYAHSQLVKIHLLESFENYRLHRCKQLSKMGKDLSTESDSLLKSEIGYWLWAHCRFSLFRENVVDMLPPDSEKQQSFNTPDDTLLAMANRNFERGAYRQALQQYHQLESQYEPNAFLQTRIKALHTLMGEHISARLRYDSLINDATVLILQNNIREAYEKYLELEIQDTSTFVYRQRIGIEQLLLIGEEEEAMLDEYRIKCRSADKHFARGNYELAKELYADALKLAPGKVYPRIQLQALDRIEKENERQELMAQKQQELYRQLIGNADSLFNIRKLQAAREKYQQAWRIDSASTYLKRRIIAVNRLIEEQTHEQRLIDSLMDVAERSYQNENLDQANKALRQLLRQDPENVMAIRQLAEVQRLQVQQQRQRHYRGLWQEVKHREDAGRWQHACQLVQQMAKTYPDSTKLQKEANRICLRAKSVNAQWQADVREDSVKLVLMLKAKRNYQAGNLDEASLLYQELIALYPDNGQLKREVAKVKQAAKKAKQIQREESDQLPKDTLPVIEQEYKEAFNLPDTVERVTYLRNLADQYPEGVTIQYAKVKGRSLTRYIVVKEGLADEYWKVEHDWGGVFYFKNGRSISYNVFKIETNP
jgi:tetratricopeptide (TPR) repeat protein